MKPIKRAKLDLLRASKIVHTEMLTGTGNQIKLMAKNRFLHTPGIDKYSLSFI